MDSKMKQIIEKLTEQQEQDLIDYREEWLRVGRSTGAIDIDETKAVLADFYKFMGKPAPRFVVFASPEQCCIGLPLFLRALGKKDERPLREQALEVYRSRYAQRWWTGWVAFYRFAEQLGVVYPKKQSDLLAQWERLSKACHWFFPFENWCVLSRGPTVMDLDQHGRIHGGIEYADGTGVWAYHGVRVPRWVVREPQKITLALIDGEKNTEIRRAMIELYGTGRYLLESRAEQVAKDEFGILYRKKIGNEELLSVRVLNSTPEPDGTLSAEEALKIFAMPRWWKPEFKSGRFKEYFLDVHPELRPLLDPAANNGLELGDPQKLSAHAAVASTFGKRAEDYWPESES